MHRFSDMRRAVQYLVERDSLPRGVAVTKLRRMSRTDRSRIIKKLRKLSKIQKYLHHD